ncbi:receptor-type guanylate cyclase Gyc76C-like isoform X2 [Varroa jacobsoni]|uniref:receptor-type guanylate cyclase Gyc76C-like isoform X2 n=1 Tax=Varroa jacobsoni TaxID=62625 RepID=UPI000BF53AD6|nr:receptor-type guanylate cyclase Gyc76C-like isoform X2 [Varroa jacobsoni]
MRSWSLGSPPPHTTRRNSASPNLHECFRRYFCHYCVTSTSTATLPGTAYVIGTVTTACQWPLWLIVGISSASSMRCPLLLLIATLVALLLEPTLTAAGQIHKVGYIPQFTGNMGGSKLGLKISGALSFAAEEINNSSTILGDDKVEILFEDEGGDPNVATRIVVEMFNKNVSVIIGPENFCKTEASVATAVGLPIFSYKCNDPNIRILETNMISLVPTEKYVVDMLFALLRHFNWKKFTLIFEETESRPLQTKLKDRVAAEGKAFEMKEAYYVRPGNAKCVTVLVNLRECDHHYLSELIHQTKDNTRIYVFMGDVANLSRFVFGLAARGLTKHGEYKVIYITTDHSLNEKGFNDEYKQLSSNTDWARSGYNMGAEHTLAILPRSPRGEIEGDTFEKLVRSYNKQAPFYLHSPSSFGAKFISIYAYYLYDALMTWANAVTELRAAGRTDWNKGKVVAGHIRNKSGIPSLTGIKLLLEGDGTVVGEYELLSFKKPLEPDRQMGTFDVIGSFQVKNGEVLLNMPTNPFGDEIVLDEPSCGFDGMRCPSETNLIRKWVAGAFCAILSVVALVTTFIYRNWQYEQEIAGLLWMIDRRDLTPCQNTAISAVSKMSLASLNSGNSLHLLSGSLDVCNYRGALVVIKKLQLKSRGAGDIPRRVKKEMKLMRELHQHNVNPFIGAFVREPNEIVVCTEFCSKGSLQDILEDDDVKLDNMFIASLVMDLVKGIEYLHQSSIRVHGNLKSTNCLITNKWTLQLSDFGLHELRFTTDQLIRYDDEMQYYRSLLWRSPEQLRARAKNIYVSPCQKDDVYSFAIILHEIMSRQGAWGSYNMEPKEIVAKLCTIPLSEKDIFRPSMEDIQCQDYVVKVITDGWAENPAERPEITDVAVRLKRMRQGMKTNIVDNMVAMLEKYASNLEDLVSQRTRLLEEEKKKTENLLHRMLPETVAAQLVRGEYVVPESFDAVTIYFSDIVGFTELSSSSTPMEVVNMLNDLYTLFDSIIRNYKVYKVETIGDAYMVVSGLPERNGDQHASEISLMALELLDAVKTFRIRHRPSQRLKLRIGLHTGPVVSGVVGLTMPRYCLFGDTVNTASRMESNGEALRIHVSSQTKTVLDSIGGFFVERRGMVKMKGKGEQLTYWLKGHKSGPSRRKEQSSIPLTPLFNEPQGEQTAGTPGRRQSLIPITDSGDTSVLSTHLPAPLLPNGGAKSARTHPNNCLIQKRPSQVKLHQSKFINTPPLFAGLQTGLMCKDRRPPTGPSISDDYSNSCLLDNADPGPVLPHANEYNETDDDNGISFHTKNNLLNFTDTNVGVGSFRGNGSLSNAIAAPDHMNSTNIVLTRRNESI